MGTSSDTFDGAGPEDSISYHVLWANPDEVLLLVRLRTEKGGLYGEYYKRGEGWVEHSVAFDVHRNGQDYELLNASEAAALVAKIESGRA